MKALTVPAIWDHLMDAPRLAVPHNRFDDALGWANARAEHRRRKQRVHRQDVNGQTYWAIHDAPPRLATTPDEASTDA